MVLTKEGRAGLWGRLRETGACVVQRFAELDRAQRQPSVSPWVPIAAAVVMSALLGAAVVILMRHWAVTTVLFGGLLVGSALHHEVADVEHLISFGTVVLLAYLVGRARGRPVGADDTPAVSGHSAHVHP